MVLTINAITFKGQPLVPPISAVFDDRGGTLGRAVGNDLVLADEEKVVSGKHAIIQYENGSFYYLDKSLNGTWISNRSKRLHHDKVRLRNQDELRIGDYDLKLTISGTPDEVARSSPFEADNAGSPFIDRDIAIESLTPFSLVDDDDDPIPIHHDQNSVETIFGENHSPLHESFTPPDLEEPNGQPSKMPSDLSIGDFFGDEGEADVFAIQSEHYSDKAHDVERADSGNPEGSNLESETDNFFKSQAHRDQSSTSRPALYQQLLSTAPKPEEPEANVGGAPAELLHIFFRSAGIEPPGDYPEADIPELFRTVGMAFKELVEGLMSVLRSRAELKSHLRISMTLIQPTDNNPFKFSSSVEQALQRLFFKHQPGFISAVDAVREGYEDVRNHQLALNAGIQASLVKILKRFDPQSLADKYTEGVLLQKKAKCWDEFKNQYAQITEESIEDFFGDDFVRAYEGQIKKLRAKHDKP